MTGGAPSWEGPFAFVRFGVIERWRRRGLGSRMFESALRLYRSEGFEVARTRQIWARRLEGSEPTLGISGA